MKAQRLKQLVSGLLAALMLVALLPANAWAATTVGRGNYGDLA